MLSIDGFFFGPNILPLILGGLFPLLCLCFRSTASFSVPTFYRWLPLWAFCVWANFGWILSVKTFGGVPSYKFDHGQRMCRRTRNKMQFFTPNSSTTVENFPTLSHRQPIVLAVSQQPNQTFNHPDFSRNSLQPLFNCGPRALLAYVAAPPRTSFVPILSMGIPLIAGKMYDLPTYSRLYIQK